MNCLTCLNVYSLAQWKTLRFLDVYGRVLLGRSRKAVDYGDC